MKLFLLISFLSFPAKAEIRYPDYPASPVLVSCAKLDFSSYHRARNAESMIRSSNSDFSKPNFGGKYLFLKVPFMMGTDWLIADCETGKFIKEVLSDGEAEFKDSSFLIRMTRKSEKEWIRFTGTEFIKTEEIMNSGTTPLPSPNSSASTVESQYDSIYKNFASQTHLSSCVPLKFDSYFRAQQAKGQILKTSPNLKEPNFGGAFQLLKIELLFETIWVLADCKTGLFYNLFLAGEAHFKKDSDLVIMTESGKSPKLFVWKNQILIKKSDPIVKDSPAVENEVTKDQARILINALPNPEHHSRIEFKGLLCKRDLKSTPYLCLLHREDSKGTLQELQLSEEATSKVQPILEFYGKSELNGKGNASSHAEFLRCSIDQESCLIRSF